MKIRIRERNVEVTDGLRAHVERRLGFALARFGTRIGRVVVGFSEHAGEGADVGKRCQIEVGLRVRGVRVRDSHADLFGAVDSAADRASRIIARMFDDEQEVNDKAKAGKPKAQVPKGKRPAKRKRAQTRRGPP